MLFIPGEDTNPAKFQQVGPVVFFSVMANAKKVYNSQQGRKWLPHYWNRSPISNNVFIPDSRAFLSSNLMLI